jgi:hypothetical protein
MFVADPTLLRFGVASLAGVGWPRGVSNDVRIASVTA